MCCRCTEKHPGRTRKATARKDLGHNYRRYKRLKNLRYHSGNAPGLKDTILWTHKYTVSGTVLFLGASRGTYQYSRSQFWNRSVPGNVPGNLPCEYIRSQRCTKSSTTYQIQGRPDTSTRGQVPGNFLEAEAQLQMEHKVRCTGRPGGPVGM